ncbi:hypothetical protein CDD83_2796 [Cordyceps sp. RAO-2017]|nr:hypothetical protein CDD83_2796 [Cordyceps sp. RAO-2017]
MGRVAAAAGSWNIVVARETAHGPGAPSGARGPRPSLSRARSPAAWRYRRRLVPPRPRYELRPQQLAWGGTTGTELTKTTAGEPRDEGRQPGEALIGHPSAAKPPPCPGGRASRPAAGRSSATTLGYGETSPPPALLSGASSELVE